MVNEKNKMHVNTIKHWHHYRGKNKKTEIYRIMLFTRKLHQRKFKIVPEWYLKWQKNWTRQFNIRRTSTRQNTNSQKQFISVYPNTIEILSSYLSSNTYQLE